MPTSVLLVYLAIQFAAAMAGIGALISLFGGLIPAMKRNDTREAGEAVVFFFVLTIVALLLTALGIYIGEQYP